MYENFELEQEKRKPLAVRMVVWLMLVLATVGWPAIWHVSYAQGLPALAPRQEEPDFDWLSQSIQLAQASIDPIEQKLMNKRAGQLLRRELPDPLRQRNLQYDPDVRTPDLSRDPADTALAERQSARIQELSREEIVEGAQRGQDATRSFIDKFRTPVDAEFERANPEEGGKLADGVVNVPEIIPGYSEQGMPQIRVIGDYLYNNPEGIKAVAEETSRTLRREGCRATSFALTETQDISKAKTSARDRVLKVEFFDIEKQPIAGTDPVQYQEVTKPSTYNKGKVNLSRQFIGAGSSVFWDFVDETYAIKYTYTPYTAPRDRNFFIYDLQVALDYGAGPQVLAMPNNPNLQSYGSPQDAWTPVFSSGVPYGVTAVYVSANLYQTSVIYTPEVQGVACPPDPPQVCEVADTGGRTIRFCPGSFGVNIASMYDDQRHPDERRVSKSYNDIALNNADQKNYETDPQILAGVQRGLNAGSSAIAKELAGTCRRQALSSFTSTRPGKYHVEQIESCSETLINPYPYGCKDMKRSFGLAYLAEHNFLTVRAFNKIKVPIMDPQTGEQAKDENDHLLYTYTKEPANVEGPIRTDFTIMGGAVCPGAEDCSTEIPDDPLGTSEGLYLEYTHTPMGGNRRDFAFDGVYVQAGGSGHFTHYGYPDSAWMPEGSAQGDGTSHQLRLMAKAYSIPINDFANCQGYINHAADGFCTGAKLTCTDSAPTRTVGGVTFGPGLPNDGIVEILKDWGAPATAEHVDFHDGNGSEPVPNGPPLVLLEDKMCWQADAAPFESCTTIEDPDKKLDYFFKGDSSEWATDCNLMLDDNGISLKQSPTCDRAPAYDSCDTRFEGIFSGTCYNPNITYDCGHDVDASYDVVVNEMVDTCNGAMRCMGTECHRPNLAGNAEDQFVEAVTGMEALNFMVAEMVCSETGEPPASPDAPCTPVVFGGKPYFCKIPVGHQIGITPHCCKEARKGARNGPSWIEYLQATRALYKVARTEAVQHFLSGFDVYNNAAKHFGEIAQPFQNAYAGASGWVTENIVNPFSAGFDNLFGSFGAGGGVNPAGVAVDSKLKGGMIDGAIAQLKQKLMGAAYELLNQIAPELANAVFEVGASGAIQLTENAAAVVDFLNTAFMVYAIAKLIGHIVFACKSEEYEWGMNDRWRLCTYVDSCCGKKIRLGFAKICVEKRELYCCFKSIVARVINEQITKQNLAGNKKFGFRTNPINSSKKLGGCSINCAGFTPFELAAVDWAKVDLTEWTDTLIDSGLLNPSDPKHDYGVTSTSVPVTKTAGTLDPSEVPEFDQRSPAFKTVEGWEQNMGQMHDYAATLKEEQAVQCYDADDKKMPFTYPGCKTTP